MPKNISGAVGRGGRNFPPADVMTVQYLLNCVPASQGGPSPELAVDGAAGPRTIAAIENFQRKQGGSADGRVDPGGNTLRILQTRDPYPHQALPPGGAKGGQGKSAGGGHPGGKGPGNQPGGAKGAPFGGGGPAPPGAKTGNPFFGIGHGQPGSKGGMF